STLLNLYNIDILGSVLIHNQDKSKKWIGYSEILTKYHLNNIIFKKNIIAIEQNKQIVNLSNEAYHFKLSIVLPTKKREVALNDNSINMTNVIILIKFSNQNVNLKLLDETEFPLQITYEFKSYYNIKKY